jgi:Integrase core domain
MSQNNSIIIEDNDYDSSSELSTDPLPLSPLIPIELPSSINVSNSERVQESRNRFNRRVNDNVSTTTGEKSSFITWLKAHFDAHSKNGYVINDTDYLSLKKFLLKKSKKVDPSQLSLLSLHLHSFIDKHKLRIECVKVARSTASNTQIDNSSQYSTTKEVVGDVKNTSSLAPSSLTSSVSYSTLVPYGRIERILTRLHGDLHIKSKQLYAIVQTYFIGITREMTRKFVSCCKQCGNAKNITEKDKRKVKRLQPIHSESLFERWEIDLFNFDRVDIRNGVANYVKCYVVQCVDHKSKLRFAEYIPTKDAIHVVTFLNRVFGILGAPKILQSDNGSEFVNYQMDELASRWGFEHVRSRPYHPATNGAVENANKSLKCAIKNWIASNPEEDWTKWLPIIVHTMNSNIHLMLNTSPYQFIFNCNSWHQFNAVQAIIGEVNGGDDSSDDDNLLDDVVMIDHSNDNTMDIIINDANNPVDLTMEPFSVGNEAELCRSNNVEVRKRRRKINAFHRNQVKKMKESYDKNIIPKLYNEGDVVRLSLSEQDRRLLPQSLKINNIPVRIVQLIHSRHGNILYRVRTKDHILAQLVSTELILPSICDTTAFSSEYSWSLDDWEELEMISLAGFLKLMKRNSIASISMLLPSPEVFDEPRSVSPLQLDPLIPEAENTSSDGVDEVPERIVMFEIGSCVGLEFPNNLFGKMEGEIIPCIVLERDYFHGCIYSLGVKSATIEHWYRAEHLIPLDYAKYVNYFKIAHIKNIPEMVSNWGFVNKSKWYNYITLQGAFFMIRNLSTPIPSHYLTKVKILPAIHVADANNSPIITTNTSILQGEATQNLLNGSDNMEAPAAACFSCKQVLSDENWHRCHECKSRIHGKIICRLGADMYQDDDILYCVNCSKAKK